MLLITSHIKHTSGRCSSLFFYFGMGQGLVGPSDAHARRANHLPHRRTEAKGAPDRITHAFKSTKQRMGRKKLHPPTKRYASVIPPSHFTPPSRRKKQKERRQENKRGSKRRFAAVLIARERDSATAITETTIYDGKENVQPPPPR